MTLSNATLASRAGSLEKYCTVTLLHHENSIDIRDPFKTKVQLYTDDTEL